jgi:hypothetical protein
VPDSGEAVEVPGVVVALGASVVEVDPSAFGPFFAALLLARSFSICRAETMKLCQINAGKVPPNTGPPSNSLVIGTRLFGKPTHTATV